MRSRALILLIMLLLIPGVHADNLNVWDIEISLNDDGTSEWIVTLLYDANVTRSDYFVLANRLTGLEVITDGNFIDCQLSYPGIGVSILCNDIWSQKIQYRFRAHGLVENIENFELFKYRFSMTQRNNNFSVMIKLPLGAGFVEESRLEGTGLKSFEPDWGKEGSDGRRIFFEWKKESPRLGEAVDVAIVYEQVIGFNNMILFVIIIIAVALSIFSLSILKRRDVKDILPVLTEGERKVMEILIREKKDVDQRKIVKETDFSKAKVSRIIQDLISRDLIEKVHKGRNNIIKMKRMKTRNEPQKTKT